MTALAVLTIELCLLANLMLTCATLPDPESPTSDQQFVGRPKLYFPFEERYICDGQNEEITSVEVSFPINMNKIVVTQTLFVVKKMIIFVYDRQKEFEEHITAKKKHEQYENSILLPKLFSH